MAAQRDDSRAGAYARLRSATVLSGAGAVALAGAVTGWAAAETVAARTPAPAPSPVAPLTPAQLMALEFALPTPPPKEVVIIHVPASAAGRATTITAGRPASAPRPAAAPVAAAAPPRAAPAPAPAAPPPAATTGTS